MTRKVSFPTSPLIALCLLSKQPSIQAYTACKSSHQMGWRSATLTCKQLLEARKTPQGDEEQMGVFSDLSS